MKRPPHLRTLLAVACLVGLATTSAFADDFWLVPNAFHVATGSELVVRGQTSSRFPSSRVAVTPDRLAEVVRLAAEGATPITSATVDGPSLVLRDRPEAAGQYAIAVTIHPRSLRESAAGFRRYLAAEGAAAALARLEREDLLRGRDSVTRRYAKYAKTYVEVGRGGPRAFMRIAGHPLELVPLRDPSSLRPGDTLAVRVLFRGAPLAGVVVHHDIAAFDASRGAPPSAGHETPAEASSHRTDAAGVVQVPIPGVGMWSVRTIHVEQAAPGSGADWDTHWATIVFGVGARAPEGR